MNSLAPNLQSPRAEPRLDVMLRRVADFYGADYVLSLFAPSGSGGYGCSLSVSSLAAPDRDSDLRLKSFAESRSNLEKPKVFSSAEMLKSGETLPENERAFSEYLFYPLSACERTESLLVLARRGGPVGNFPLPEALAEELVRVTAYETSQQFVIRERVYAACRQLADVQDERHLQQVLRRCFNPIFELAGSGILLPGERSDDPVYRFFTDPGAEDETAPGTHSEDFPLIVESGKYPVFLDGAETSHKKIFRHIDLDTDKSDEALFPFFQIFADQGIRKFALQTVIINNTVSGFWLMALKTGNNPALFCNEVLQIAGEHIAAAMSSIVVYNSLKEKAGEVEVLHWLNQLLATSRDRKSLIRTIRARLEPMFSFSHSFICNVNDDDATVNLLLSDSQSRAQFHPLYQEMKNASVSLADGYLNQVILTTEPIVFDLEKLNRTRQLPLYMKVNLESGIVKMLMLSLRINTNVIGIWMICFTDEHPVLPRYFDLIKILAAPISLAVSNIRMENSLMERDEERGILMSLSSDITGVKDRDNLNLIIGRHTSRLLGLSDTAVFVLSEDRTLMPFVSSESITLPDAGFSCSCGEDECQCNRLVSRFFNSSDVNVADISEFVNDRQFHPFFAKRASLGGKSVAAISMKNDDRPIGIFCIILQEGESLNDHQLTLFKEVSYQVCKAISNILANEELARGDWEKSLLLGLSEDLATVRQKDQLIAAAKKALKAPLGFSHIALCLKTEQRIISYALDPDSRIRNHPEYKAATRENIPFNDAWVEIFEESVLPVIIKKSRLGDSPELSPIMKLNLECGINEMVIAKLYDGVRYFGFWVIFSEHESTGSSDLKLIQSVASQLSTALLNVLANQEIADRDEEKEYLIQIGNAMAGIRSYSEFFEFVNNKCGSKLGFTESFIVIAEPDAGSSVKIFSNNADGTQAEITAGGSSGSLSLSDEIVTELIGSPLNLIIRAEERRCGLYPELNNILTSAEGTVVIAKFQHRNKILGLWGMYYPEGREIDSKTLRMMDSVKGQLSIVIENIFADEKEALFASQKSILFSLSQHVSAARNFTSLLETMDHHVRSVLGYHHTNIKLLNDDDGSSLPGTDIPRQDSGSHAQFPGFSLSPLKDEQIAQVMVSAEPWLFEVSGFQTEEKRSGDTRDISHLLLTRLEVNEEVLGLWVICFQSRPAVNQDYFNLVKGIRDTLSLAALNIILNERINRREQEKSSLLDFSKAVAGVKDKFQLGAIFHSYLKNLCNLEELCLHWLDEDKKNQYCFFWDTDSAYTSDPDFENICGGHYSVNDGIFDQVLTSRSPVNIDIEQYLQAPDAPFYLKFFKKHGFTAFAALPIFKGDDVAGVLFVRGYTPGEADQPLFRSLSSQLAIAVSDLIATERVVRQLAEINRYKERLEEEKVYLTQELETTHNYSEIIGKSPVLKAVFKMISQVAQAESTVLILGETGTGKELIARAIHNDSPRKNNLMVKVNCAALPANLIESELFGHEKGSFTGATERRIGKFELAHGGTLFLDEIGEMPAELQVKLLRALQEKEIERIGGKGSIKADVRIIAATNRNLEQEINAGRFRSDLYFRISTFPIQLPALRERKDDIPLLALHFVRRFAKRAGKVIDNISSKAMNELVAYSWPGNVRELEHQIERCVLTTGGPTIKDVHLPSPLQSGSVKEAASEEFLPGTFDKFEKDYIVKTLKYCKGKVSGAGGAAEILGIPASTLTSRMKRLNITKKFLE